MTEDNSSIATMRAVTLSREYGSGGGEIASRLAERLGWQLIDHEVVVRVAQRLHITEAQAEANDERVEGLASRILNSLWMLQYTMPVVVDVPLTIDSRAFHEARCQVIEGAVATGRVVIVGRGAQAHLAHKRDVFHARIVAPLEARIAYVMRREGLKQTGAYDRIRQKDDERRRYLQTFYKRDPADPHLYDLTVNTGVLDLDSAADVISLALERKAMRLAASVQELGPIAGLDRYPGQPEDFKSRQ